MNLLKASNNSIIWRLISVSTIIFLSSVGFVWAAANNNTLVKNAPKHSFNFQNEPFESVCKTISRATGYKIKFDDNFSKLPVTANFEETTAFGALKKILRVHNHSLVLNEENRSIEVFIVPSVDFSARKRLAALPPQNEGSATETQPEDMNESIENNDPTAAEAMEAYAQEYIMQTAAGEEADVIEADDINEYAEEYISRSKADEPVAIEAESMEAYAQEYIKQTSPGKDPDFVGATDINSYAEAYIDHVSKNDKISSPIIASDINEYADEYIRRQREGNFEE
ncbi:MAG: hypothetical protein MUD10_04250 [Candidatus Pacebacteria bacterium]|nr:hypothetical protein [Candidatus Paceibacterota bacterium]